LRAKTQDKIIVPTGIPNGNYTFVEDYAELVLKAMTSPLGERIHYNASTHTPHSFSNLIQLAANYWNTDPKILEISKEKLLEQNICGGRDNISLWFQGALMFDHQAVLDDFSPKYHDVNLALYQTIEYYNHIYGENWKDGIYGWTMAAEKAFCEKLSL
jgi:nucleoside-diphosphate-sugar epimerase